MDLPLSLDRNSHLTLQLNSFQNSCAARSSTVVCPPGPGSLHALPGGVAGVSRNVAFAAFDELYAEGFVEGRHGSGTFVTMISRSPKANPT